MKNRRGAEKIERDLCNAELKNQIFLEYDPK